MGGVNQFLDEVSRVETVSELEEVERRYLKEEQKPVKKEEKKYPQPTSVLASFIFKAWREHGFVGAITFGAQGVGKSIYNILVAKQVLDAVGYNVTINDVIDSYVVFRVEDFLARLRSAPRIPVLVWDDAGIHASSDLWFLDRRKVHLLGAVFQTVRTKLAGLMLNATSPGRITSKLRDHGTYAIVVVKRDSMVSEAIGYRLYHLPSGLTFIKRIFVDTFDRHRDWYPYYLKKRMKYADEALAMLEEHLVGNKKRSTSGRRGKRLDPQKKETIIRMLREGKTYREIAKELGVGQNTIAKIKKEILGVERG